MSMIRRIPEKEEMKRGAVLMSNKFNLLLFFAYLVSLIQSNISVDSSEQ
jgi:hypothetical protein